MTDASIELEGTAGRAASVRDTAADFLALLKPRVMSLVVFTALAGMVLAPGSVHPFMAIVSLVAIAVGAGASGALNMWYDADIDAVMARTRNRPVPAGRVTAGEAAGFGGVLSFFSVLVLAFSANYLAAALLAFTIFFYVVVYTMWLKRSTPQNIVIGGAAGAFPPMIGWAAVTGTIPVESFVLFGIIFMWTPPHFWALSLFKAGEYADVGVPMLPVVRGRPETRRQILLYTIAMIPVTLLPWIMGFASAVYGIAAMALGAGFLWLATALYRRGEADAGHRAAKRLFGFSILYLFGLFALLLGEGIAARSGLL